MESEKTNEKEKYLAHISDDKKREQTVLEHNQRTALLAGEFASKFGCREWGQAVGLCHDIGKYSKGFQKRLLEKGPAIDHSTAGAQELYARGYIMAAYCVAGHHSGLQDGGSAAADESDAGTFLGRMKKQVEDYSAFREETEIPKLPDVLLKPLGKGGFSVSFFIRMLFSCLIDADRLDTEHFMMNGMVERGGYDRVEILMDRMQAHIASWFQQEDLSTVNGRRTAILKSCLEKGKEEPGLFQLTVPTGGGKTTASLAFALQQMKTYGMERVIYAIPYISIIEQNAQVFKDILGRHNVLEDHSNVSVENPEELRKEQLAAENWDRPVVVTTNVQFFESLFSNQTSKCRKLHNIANSVIILDEAQMLPAKYLIPCIWALSELICNYHCTVVLCTATQPSLEPYFPKGMQARELCPDVNSQYEFFRRTRLIYGGVFSEKELAERLQKEEQVLCILNSRKRVQRIYRKLNGEGVYHLSTLMYPNHRKRVLKEVRERLADGLPCCLIATSLVEAGVDLDLKTVYRELAGIDSVIQAAGRCNREGKRSREESLTVVFTMDNDEEKDIPAELKQPIAVAEQIQREFDDIFSLEAIHEYFERLYRYKGESLDSKEIVEQFEQGILAFSFPFETAASQFHLIEERTKTILVDKEPEARRIAEQLRAGCSSREVMRQAGGYCIQVYDNLFEDLRGAGLIEELFPEFYRLRSAEQYREDVGLLLNVSRGDAVFA